MKFLKIRIFFIFLLFANLPFYCFSSTDLVPRTVIVLFKKSKDIPKLKFTLAHRFAEMPLNYLGLTTEYHDLSNGLPNIANRKDVRGVLTWFEPGFTVGDPNKYLSWAIKCIASDKKFVIIGNPGFISDEKTGKLHLNLLNNFFSKLDLNFTNEWLSSTYNINLINNNKDIVEFERSYPIEKPPFYILHKWSNDLHVYLSAEIMGAPLNSILICTSPNGGYIAEKYAANISKEEIVENVSNIKWYINPFLYFREAFQTSGLPAPSITTLAGRRIYFSHIDGDGWLNYTQIEDYKLNPVYSSEIILNKIIKPYPELPVSVGPVMAELDLNEKGTLKAQEIAKEMFNLKNVDIGSHTYTHPLEWDFFKNYNREEELKISNKIFSFNKKKNIGETGDLIKESYEIPRPYNKFPFDLNNEITGGKQFIEALANNGKKNNTIFWSGDTTPFEEAVSITRKAGMRNINGGDSRLDREYPSYLWVSPIGVQIGDQRQIYAASSNENTYTNLWTNNFFAFKYLIRTLKNTESPIRIKPMNIYYHMYTGEKKASIEALKYNLDYAMQSEICPVTVNNYCGIADGFYTTEIYKTGKSKWLFKNRDQLETIRFPKGIYKKVNFVESKGVIGQRNFQGSLYVYLDSSYKVAEIQIEKNSEFWKYPDSKLPYLIESRWQIFDLKRDEDSFSFQTKGFGKGEMRWHVAKNGNYNIYVNGKNEISKTTSKKILKFTLLNDSIEGINIKVKKQ